MSLKIESTTDTVEQVNAALGIKKSNDAAEDSKNSASPSEKEEDKTNAKDSEAKAKSEDNSTEQDSGEESDEKDSNEDQPSKSGKTNVQKRFDKLTRQRVKAQQEADFWKAEALKMREQSQPNQENQKPQENMQKPSEAAGKPNPDDYAEVSDYYEALAEWKYEKKQAEAAEKSRVEKQKSDYNSQLSNFRAKSQELATKHADFNEVLEDIDDVVITPGLQAALLSSDNGPELLYELGKNRAEMERINGLSYGKIERELGKFESRLAKPSEVKNETKTTQAPAPLKTVGSGSLGSTKDPNEMSFREYKKWREAGNY